MKPVLIVLLSLIAISPALAQHAATMAELTAATTECGRHRSTTSSPRLGVLNGWQTGWEHCAVIQDELNAVLAANAAEAAATPTTHDLADKIKAAKGGTK